MGTSNEHPLISIGLVGIRDTDTVPVGEIFSTIADQEFPSVELLICPDSGDESLIQEILEALHCLPADRFLRTLMRPCSFQSGAAEAMKRIIEQAAGEFLIFHTLSETLYDTQVLSNYWNAFQGQKEALGLMRTLVVKKSDQSWQILPETDAYAGLTGISPAEQLRWLGISEKNVCNGGMCFRTAALRKAEISGASYEEALFSFMLSAGRNGILIRPEFCATRHYCDEFPEGGSLLPLYDTHMETPPVRGAILNLTD